MHCISFFCTVFHFLALYFEKNALLLANQDWYIFSSILLIIGYKFMSRSLWMLAIFLILWASPSLWSSPCVFQEVAFQSIQSLLIIGTTYTATDRLSLYPCPNPNRCPLTDKLSDMKSIYVIGANWIGFWCWLNRK